MKRGWNLSEETKRKMKIAQKGLQAGENHPFFGKHHSEETKNKISNSIKSSYENGERVPSHCGKHFSEETKKKMSESHKGLFSGEKNPMYGKRGEKCHLWKGGISFEPYSLDWVTAFKEDIRNRDNNTCQLCGKEWEVGTKAFHVHHIDYDKKNCAPENLTTLCLSCHSKTNHNRELWLGIFEAQLVLNRNRWSIKIVD